ncbi:hypothetical protein AMJ39_00880 [candidate division TA06 bacterium DG_24]|uniref:Phosphatidate cytidylyltransferase n=3 Tax=Bacteria division TA06 TaxID=1156500 RepID=A0A0S8JP94_UNCT6|nr:MAG: hypothetical protein AMJ39_00880 [candidate division TA06 bacterium DG_24]KPK70859.1 MAG: hypothetical protein AMJ82_01815 [candidate division TA06 bacterium SM23_40]KPL11575.1 MAG: hypothetical protein AMJ71_00355 [candidate division TA06 bacterium SM1_40]
MTLNLVRRIVTACLYIPILVIILHEGGIYYLILVELLIGVGTYEYYRIMETKGTRPRKTLGIGGAVILGFGVYFQNPLWAFTLFTLVLFVAMVSELFRRDLDRAIFHIAGTIFGILYVGWLGSHLLLLRELPRVLGTEYSEGTGYALLPYVLTWAFDTTAYFAGIGFGRRKLLARISPEKSVEGVVYGTLSVLVMAFVARAWFARYLTIGDCIGLGVLVSAFATIGDLIESLIKRDANLKDSAKTIPGHGGVLDRFDSLLLTAPITYYYLRFFVLR